MDKTADDLQIWAGVECTHNRVGDEYLDQLERSGHSMRCDDLDRLAALGVSAVRYPVLWERIAPQGPSTANWEWSDARLARLRQLGVRVIAGLVHHGSGPRYTDLLDPQFGEKLAEYAGAVAERYPWISDYTPVNEPLTTARFSALYGHWYPHATDDASFLKALMNQMRGTVLAMRAIRRVNPAARLIQTEDLSKTHATPRMRYQAEFENQRRWLGFDLLRGAVEQEHPLWRYLMSAGVLEEELEWFRQNRCPPEIYGFNYYVTSERFLDEHLQRYPLECHGGNGRDFYADVEAVRYRAEGLDGAATLLLEAQQRFGGPLAITEAHLGCTREEQVRWLLDVVQGAKTARQCGADVRAVTAWAAFGIFDWDGLAVCSNGCYEPGIFDVQAPEPRKTALAPVIRELSRGGQTFPPWATQQGWWRRPLRSLEKFVVARDGGMRRVEARPAMHLSKSRPILITGNGTLANALARICEVRGLAYRQIKRAQMDIACQSEVRAAIKELQPWAVVNAAGYVRVDDAESDCEKCWRENVEGPQVLAAECARAGVALATFSSDMVFDGAKGSAYVESDAVAPLNQYGRTKAEAELRVLNLLPGALVVRTSAFFGPWDRYNFVYFALSAIAERQAFPAATDAIVSPTYVPDLAHMTLDLLMDGERGVWHVANQGQLSWYDLARMAARAAGLGRDWVRPCSTAELNCAAVRPAFSALTSEKQSAMPTVEEALERFARECTELARPSLVR